MAPTSVPPWPVPGPFALVWATRARRLIAEGFVDLGLTTNFDDLVEQAAESARAALTTSSRPRLGIAALGDPARASLALSDDDFPLLVKLHGDFASTH